MTWEVLFGPFVLVAAFCLSPQIYGIGTYKHELVYLKKHE